MAFEYPVTLSLESYREDWLRKLAACDPRIKAEAVKALSMYAGQLWLWMSHCESPIEQLLALTLHSTLQYEEHHRVSWDLTHQFKISTESGEYRLDMLLCMGRNDQLVQVAIECDGHDFHEKTKAQAARDKRRDRAIQAKDISVMRFTGSEIWNNPDECAKQVILAAWDLYEKRYGPVYPEFVIE